VGCFLSSDGWAILRGSVECHQQVCIYSLAGRFHYDRWTNDERMMTVCFNNGTRPVIFKIQRIDIPEAEEKQQDLANHAEDTYTG